jgi:hypothetical protein
MKKSIVALFALAVPGALAPGCVDNNVGLTVTGIALVDTTKDCKVEPNTNEFRGFGTIDLNVARAYFLFPIVQNNMIANTNQTLRVLNGRTAYVRGITASYQPPSAQVVLPATTFPVFGVVEPGLRLGVPVQTLSEQQIDALRGDPSITPQRSGLLFVNFRVNATLTDGSTIDTGPVGFPIRVCRGCLRDPTCAIATGGATFCNAGQDDLVDCPTYDQLAR